MLNVSAIKPKYPPPFGMQIQERSYVSCYAGYRFGFNSMERDDEVKGDGNSLDFGARIYDSRLGRWLSVDALSSRFPGLSTYSFVKSCPILLVDSDGNTFHITFWSSEAQRDAFKRIIENRFDNLVNVTYVKSTYQREESYIENGETKIHIVPYESYEPRITINETAVRELMKSGADENASEGEVDWLTRQYVNKIKEDASYAYLDHLFNKQTPSAYVSLVSGTSTGSYRADAINALSLLQNGENPFSFNMLLHEVSEQAAKAQKLYSDGQGLIKGTGYPSAHFFALGNQVKDFNSQNGNNSVVAVLTDDASGSTDKDFTMTVYSEIRASDAKGNSKVTGYKKTVYLFQATRDKILDVSPGMESIVTKKEMDADIAGNKVKANKVGSLEE